LTLAQDSAKLSVHRFEARGVPFSRADNWHNRRLSLDVRAAFSNQFCLRRPVGFGFSRLVAWGSRRRCSALRRRGFLSEIFKMAKLDAAERNALPKKEFAGPGRSYPVPDRSHAGNAKARAKEMLNKGHISSAEYSKIVSKADRVLGK
jgi:hypothetical protein